MSAPALAAERLAAAELPALAAMLAEAALPSADVASAPGAFFRFRDESGAVIGYAGLEIHGGDALLRSVLVCARRCVGAASGAPSSLACGTKRRRAASVGSSC